MGEGPIYTAPDVLEEERFKELERLRKRRSDSVWFIGVGIALMFTGGVHVGLATGGAASAIFGMGSYLYWSVRMHRNYDPWQDPELDAWEDEEML